MPCIYWVFMKKTKQKYNHAYIFTLEIFLVFFLLFGCPTRPVFAWTFDPNNILSDQELKDKQSLSKSAIQVFLEWKNSALKNFREIVNGTNKTAGEILWEVAQANNVSPKFLLAMLEKEKGLIQKSQATQKDFDWATGYSCHSGQCNEKYKGFFNQVESTAITQNIYFDRAAQFSFQRGVSAKTNDGYIVTQANQATANLYIYTPYIGYAPDYGYKNIETGVGKFGANYLFWQIWTRFFSDKKIPNGFVVKNQDNYWLIENGKKRKYATKEIYLKDQKDADAVFIAPDTLGAYEDGPQIHFSNNTLVRSSTNNQVFLIIDQVRRPIVDNSLSTLDEIPVVENSKIENYPIGNPITSTTAYPLGKLFQNDSGTIYLVKDSMKYLVSPDVWKINFNKTLPEKTTNENLEKYPLATK